MQLDNTQPWMRNHVIKIRILLAPQPMQNPVMRAYQEEFQRMALVRKEERPRPS